jgi:hypothetical protein
MNHTTIGSDAVSFELCQLINENKRFKGHCLRRINAFNRMLRPITDSSDVPFASKKAILSMIYERALVDIQLWSTLNHFSKELEKSKKRYLYLMITYFKIKIDICCAKAEVADAFREWLMQDDYI